MKRKPKTWLLSGVSVVGLLYAAIAYAQTVTLGRQGITFPDLGHPGGSTQVNLQHTAIETLSDDSNAKFQEYSAVPNGTTNSIIHNLGVELSELKVLIYSGNHPSLTRIENPTTIASPWTIVATSGQERVSIDVTTPASGGPHTYAVVVIGSRTDKTSEIESGSALDVLGLASSSSVQSALEAANNELDIPFRLYANDPADAILNIGSNEVDSGDGSKQVNAPNANWESFPGATINFQTGAVTGSVVLEGGAFSLPVCLVTDYIRVVFVYDSANNRIDSKISGFSNLLANLQNPSVVYQELKGAKLGWIDLQCTNASGQYKTADSATDVVENSQIYRFGNGDDGSLNVFEIVNYDDSDDSETLKSEIHYSVKLTGAAITLNLPAGETGSAIRVSDDNDNFATFNVTIDGNGSETIAGSLTYTLDSNGSSYYFYWTGTGWEVDISASNVVSVPEHSAVQTGTIPPTSSSIFGDKVLEGQTSLGPATDTPSASFNLTYKSIFSGTPSGATTGFGSWSMGANVYDGAGLQPTRVSGLSGVSASFLTSTVDTDNVFEINVNQPVNGATDLSDNALAIDARGVVEMDAGMGTGVGTHFFVVSADCSTGTCSPTAIHGSKKGLSISSANTLGVGAYQINFTPAFPTSVKCAGNTTTNDNTTYCRVTATSTSAFEFRCKQTTTGNSVHANVSAVCVGY